MTQILSELKKYSTPDRKNSNEWFFKTGIGQYGEGDKFIGVSNPSARLVVAKFANLEYDEIQKSLNSEIHEERLVAILILVNKFEKAKADFEKREIVEFYLENLSRINNWDLVDCSAPKILGQAIFDKLIDENILDKLAVSKIMWERRIAIISTLIFIKYLKFDATLRIAKVLLKDKEDLMHKAVGWALREVWKKEPELCEKFLLENYNTIPRTSLRYAIERMEESKRKEVLYRKKYQLN